MLANQDYANEDEVHVFINSLPVSIYLSCFAMHGQGIKSLQVIKQVIQLVLKEKLDKFFR